MNDRLADLGSLPAWADEEQQGSSTDDQAKAYHPLVDKGDNTKQTSSDSTTASYDPTKSIMDTFFGDVEQIKSDINFIINATNQIQNLNEKLLSTTSEEQEKELGFQLRVIIDQGNKHAKNCKNMLALLKEENVKMKKENKLNLSDIRVRENLCTTLTRKFIDEMKGYQGAQQTYKTDLRDKVKRSIQIFKPDVKEEEINDIIKSGGREEYVKTQILAGTAVSDDIKTSHQHVSGKYKDILTIESSIAELHQMFLDFALLTEQQGELLDQIAFNVENAVDYTEEANIEVQEAVEYAKEARKKQCMIAGIIIFVIIILILIIMPKG